MAFERFKFSLGPLLLCFVILTFDTVKASCNSDSSSGTTPDKVPMIPPAEYSSTTQYVTSTTQVDTTTLNPCDVSSIECKNGGTRYVTDEAQCKCQCPDPWAGDICDEIQAFNYTGCADDFLTVIANGVELDHTRKINTSVSVFVPQGTKVLGIRAQNSFLGGGWKGIATDGRYPSNTQWRCTTEQQLDNRWASEGFDDSSWPLIQYAKTNYTWMCADYPLSAQWVWVDNYTYLGISYCRIQIGPSDNTLPACSANCLSCVDAGAGLCDEGQCYPGYAYNSTNKLCDGKCSKFCAKCDINGANKCDPGPGGCTSGYFYDIIFKVCNPNFFTACSNDNIWLYADGIFQKAASNRFGRRNAKISFQIPAFTVVLAVKDNNTVTGTAGWRGFSTDGSIVSSSAWKCTNSVPDENSWKERDFDDSAWLPALTSNNIYAPLPVALACSTGFPVDSKFLWTEPTFSTIAVMYCRLRIDRQ